MKLSRYGLAPCALAFFLAGTSSPSAKEQKISCDAVPAPVRAAFEKAFSKATINECAKDVERRKTTYEIVSTEGEINRHVRFHPDGKVMEVEEPIAETLPDDRLGHEWEWEGTPEVTLRIVRDTAEAVALFNAQSPQFIASLIAEDPAAHERFFATINAPFVGNGFTRWVDGQYTLNRPELGLSNWQYGRLFGRGGILTGDGVYTVRTRAVQTDFDVHR